MFKFEVSIFILALWLLNSFVQEVNVACSVNIFNAGLNVKLTFRSFAFTFSLA